MDTDVLNIINLSKSFKKRQVLKNVSFKIKAGDIVGFVGPNASGKTTTMKCCVGLLKRIAGDVEIVGQSITKKYEEAVKNVLWIPDQNAFYENFSANTNLKIYTPFYRDIDKEDFDAATEKVGLYHRMKDNVGTYSLGMTRRLALAKCLIIKPKLILMDEPLNGLDPVGVEVFKNMVVELSTNYGMSFLISSHNLNVLSDICHRIVTINNGTVLGEIDVRNNTIRVVKLVVEDADVVIDLLKKNFNIDATQAENKQLLFDLDKSLIPNVIKLVASKDRIISISTAIDLEKTYIDLFRGAKIE